MPLSKALLTKLYLDNKLSLSEISKHLNVSIHKTTYWMEKYKIQRRPQKEANYIKANPTGDPFFIKRKLSLNDLKLKHLALGLYWGEGSKNVKRGVRITNSDSRVIKVFVNYLTKLCNAKNDKIHYYLQVFKDNNINVAKEYWSSQLSVKTDKIKCGKPISSMGKGTYKKISHHGVMTVAFCNTHLCEYILNEISKINLK